MCHRLLFVVVVISTSFTGAPPCCPPPPPCLPTPVGAYFQFNQSCSPFPFALLQLPPLTTERDRFETYSCGVAADGASRRVRRGCLGELQQARIPHAGDPPIREKDVAQCGQDNAVSWDIPLEGCYPSAVGVRSLPRET